MRYMVQPVSFRWDEDFLARLDTACGEVPRSRWVRRAIEERIEREKVEPLKRKSTKRERDAV